MGTGSSAGSASGVTLDDAAARDVESSGSITMTLGSSSLKVAGRRWDDRSPHLQSVSDQELEGAVKADVRQNGAVRVLSFEQRWPETQKAEIGVFFRRAGEATETRLRP